MAQKVSVTLVDDLDGSIAGQTVGFGLDGVVRRERGQTARRADGVRRQRPAQRRSPQYRKQERRAALIGCSCRGS
jgi:hypothetical protein